MLGGTIGARAIGDGGKRALPSEQAGPRPAGVRDEAVSDAPNDERRAIATKP